MHINLTHVSASLAVKKRRIYDITNVLEVAGYIRKSGKNTVELVHPTPTNSNAAGVQHVTVSKLATSSSQLHVLETRLQSVQHMNRVTSEYVQSMVERFNDIKRTHKDDTS
uniref:Transcription factor E2FC n=1 Tax=Lygus hesperus TaxID=30085 RepID=A0A0A9WDT4_LYGHE